MSWLIEISIIVLLTLANGVFAGAEIAIISVRSTRLEELAAAGGSGVALARLRANPERFLATVQIGITVVGATTAAFGGATLADRLAELLQPLGMTERIAADVALVAVVIGVSYLTLVLGELVPKSLGLKWSERYALAVARPLALLATISAPFVRLLTGSSNLVLRAFGDHTSFTESQISRDELLSHIGQAVGSGEVSERASKIATRAIDLDELHVSALMTPRSAIVAIDTDATIDDLGRQLDASDEERYPVQRGDDILGYVTTRDLGRLIGGRVTGGLGAITRSVHVVPETAYALDVLDALQRRRVAIAVVVDEAGGVEGILDIDDLAEELVGSLLVGAKRDDGQVVSEPDGAAIVPASMRVHVANRRLDLDLPQGARWSTIGGLLLFRAGSVPAVGARVALDDGTELEVVEATARRVHSVRIRRRAPAA